MRNIFFEYFSKYNVANYITQIKKQYSINNQLRQKLNIIIYTFKKKTPRYLTY